MLAFLGDMRQGERRYRAMLAEEFHHPASGLTLVDHVQGDELALVVCDEADIDQSVGEALFIGAVVVADQLVLTVAG